MSFTVHPVGKMASRHMDNVDSSADFSKLGALSPVTPARVHEVKAYIAGLHQRIAPGYDPMQIVTVLMTQLTQKSLTTARHSVSVAHVSRILAESLHIDAVMVERIALAALLHDVGKLMIPSSVLEKQSALSAGERRCIQSHAIVTDVILSTFPGFDAVSDIAALHHEHLNGTGYPYGVSAAGLDITVRIIAVADIFAALTEERSYRHGESNASAIHRLSMLAEKDIVDSNVVSRAQDVLLTVKKPSFGPLTTPTRLALALDFEQTIP
ncbi:MAG: HD domain-containing protein [Deltaproteobacteria bacterium]|nr:HD domain-containing protein [Deltaproteobacteria bacterium]